MPPPPPPGHRGSFRLPDEPEPEPEERFGPGTDGGIPPPPPPDFGEPNFAAGHAPPADDPWASTESGMSALVGGQMVTVGDEALARAQVIPRHGLRGLRGHALRKHLHSLQ